MLDSPSTIFPLSVSAYKNTFSKVAGNIFAFILNSKYEKGGQ